ncbi:phage holin [Thermaerobacillus caldiproteolyticus]|uniref:SPP1 family holin n=1 Tax=Thermaerobacillus caldiproteolyticus TaxID=247480 RepID=A0A7V9Z5A0_9BACL|nr:phage holin [Anoxybacillus caldiproteolyticus]MBA2874294.1 SPP1 family holin [Anoxybacillus caldiproteolyticus]
MDKASTIRFVFLIVAVINAVLNMLGYQTIPDDLVNDVVAVVSGIYALYMGWKNNYLSKKGRKQKEVLEKHGLS